MAITQEFFEKPPKQYRPWTVWWWFGSASTSEDLVWELQQMDAHGIGGVEINPVYALHEEGASGAEVFGTEWQQRFLAVVREAERLGMKIWLRAGSGWPLGGPWITPELASQSLARAVVDLRGPQTWSSGALPKPVAPTRWSHPQLECVTAIHSETGERRVLLADGARARSPRFAVPAGAWQAHFIYSMRTNMQVKRPAPGGSGPVLDHYSTAAIDKQLAVLDRFAATARRDAPNAFIGIAEDSLELDDDNWTAGLLGEFQRRRGYDLHPFLPDLWEDTPNAPGVRQDFLRTVSDLMIERHFDRMSAWAAKHGLLTMVEAHGSMTDTLRAYAAADVPDGETIWEYKERQEVNIRNRRVASSAAHIYGKSIAAAESYTWLRMPRFLVKPWMVKAASDAIYLDGINHIRNHGYSSSPRRHGKPGQVFYASTLINHNQTWWPHYPAISAYVARMNYALQQGQPANDIWIYHNLWDGMADYKQPTPEWMKGDNAWHRPDINPGIDGSAQIAMRTRDVAESLRVGGYGFDYINDHALETRLPVNPKPEDLAGIRALVFPRTRFVPAATLRKLLTLVNAGVHILALGNPPEAGVGYAEQQDGKAEWQAAFDALWKTGKLTVVSDAYAMRVWLDFRPMPDFQKDAAGADLGFIHRKDERGHLYFISNGSENSVTSKVTLRQPAQSVERWDAYSGETATLPFTSTEDGRTQLQLQLGPWESCLLVLGERPSTSPAAAAPLAFFEPSDVMRLDDWEIYREGEDTVTPLTDGPADWETLPGWKDFAGIGVYQTTVRIPSPGQGEGFRYVLDLGSVEASAEVRVGGKHAGYVILPPWRIDLSRYLVPGMNQIEVRVANLWSNAVQAMPPAPSKIPGPGYGVTDVLYGPAERPQQRSGLLGPVRLLVGRVQA
ncbi:MAG: hypothetical protein KIT83_15905 [Bryobacterales bacterium]|nr:hypothetical protein [Bryobacterales bacterium]